MRQRQHRLNPSNRSLHRLLVQQDGFTLVEMLVVITIIGLVVGLVGQPSFGIENQGSQNSNRRLRPGA